MHCQLAQRPVELATSCEPAAREFTAKLNIIRAILTIQATKIEAWMVHKCGDFGYGTSTLLQHQSKEVVYSSYTQSFRNQKML